MTLQKKKKKVINYFTEQDSFISLMIYFAYYVLIQMYFRKLTSVLIGPQILYSGLGQLTMRW